MKIAYEEYGDNFSIDLEAENKIEAAFLTRLGLMARAEQRRPLVTVGRDGSFSARLRLRKSKAADNFVGGHR
jgi:hypothetical protein